MISYPDGHFTVTEQLSAPGNTYDYIMYFGITFVPFVNQAENIMGQK